MVDFDFEMDASFSYVGLVWTYSHTLDDRGLSVKLSGYLGERINL